MNDFRTEFRPVDRKVVERIAGIVGESSAASAALRRAASMRDPLFFEGASSWFVVERTAFNALLDSFP